MKKHRQFMMALLLVFAMVLTFIPARQIAFAEAPQVFTEVVSGMRGEMTVDVTIEGDKIIAVEVVETVDSPVISDAAIESVPARIVDQQNVEVDSTTGATMTSLAIKRAVSLAIEEAGLNPDNYKKGSDSPEKKQAESQSYDVVIVGSGMAGLSAAIEAARISDASILVLEKNAYTGGSSRVCGGGIWAVDSKFNEEAGINSTLEELIDFMKMRSGGKELNEALIANMYAKAGDTMDYFVEHGLPVKSDNYYMGHSESKLPCFDSVYNAAYPWETGESRMIDYVQQMAEDLGVEIRVNSRVTGLIGEDGSIKGVKVSGLDEEYEVKADKVILATGGFTRNPDMVAEYAPDYIKAIPFTGAGSTGDGITMAKEYGAVVFGEGMMGLMGLNMNVGYYGSIGNLVWSTNMTVNKEGLDFGFGNLFYADKLRSLVDQTDCQAYGIFDNTTEVTERLDDAVNAGLAQKFDTLEALADKYGIDADALLKTAEEKGLQDGPYYGMILRPLFIGSIPGLKVDDCCRVLTAEGSVIENLYACGELIFANVFQSTYPASGSGMGSSAYSGAVAAQAAISD